MRGFSSPLLLSLKLSPATLLHLLSYYPFLFLIFLSFPSPFSLPVFILFFSPCFSLHPLFLYVLNLSSLPIQSLSLFLSPRHPSILVFSIRSFLLPLKSFLSLHPPLLLLVLLSPFFRSPLSSDLLFLICLLLSFQLITFLPYSLHRSFHPSVVNNL